MFSPLLRNVAQLQDFGIAWSAPPIPIFLYGFVSSLEFYLLHRYPLLCPKQLARTHYLAYMLQRMLDRALPMYVVIAYFLSLTYHQLSILLFPQALTRKHWIRKLCSFLRQPLILALGPHLEMTLLKEMMSMANYELQEVMLSFQLANQTPVYLLSIHW